jgi:hypothetical protein
MDDPGTRPLQSSKRVRAHIKGRRGKPRSGQSGVGDYGSGRSPGETKWEKEVPTAWLKPVRDTIVAREKLEADFWPQVAEHRAREIADDPRQPQHLRKWFRVQVRKFERLRKGLL